jgi:hypothetical protein
MDLVKNQELIPSIGTPAAGSVRRFFPGTKNDSNSASASGRFEKLMPSSMGR